MIMKVTDLTSPWQSNSSSHVCMTHFLKVRHLPGNKLSILPELPHLTLLLIRYYCTWHAPSMSTLLSLSGLPWGLCTAPLDSRVTRHKEYIFGGGYIRFCSDIYYVSNLCPTSYFFFGLVSFPRKWEGQWQSLRGSQPGLNRIICKATQGLIP